MQRGKQFYQNIWMMLHLTYHEVFVKYINTYPDISIHITFCVLKPFYLRTETEKDIEICCCKLHLHAGWAIEALTKCALEQHIDIPFSNYTTFFDMLTRNCEENQTMYISWSCTPNKNTFYNNIKENWQNFSEGILASSSPGVHVTLTPFEMVKYAKKNGEITTKLKPVSRESSLDGIVQFINSFLPTIINHRNHLQHYRIAITNVRAMFDSLFIDIDFSENLKLPVKFEPQSLHWCHETITMNFGIVKLHREKSYRSFVFDDKKYDQTFVKHVFEEMLETVENISKICIIERDNCSSQYKSVQHFHDIQNIYNTMVSASFPYSVQLDMVKGKSIMLGD